MARYQIDGRDVPSVTEIIGTVIGRPFQCDPWYMQRGTAVHACADMICRGVEFDHDPAISGYVAAVRAFLADTPCDILATEERVESRVYQYAGRLDARIIVKGRHCVLDWKSGAVVKDYVALQLAGYSEAHPARPPYGIAVMLANDGTYKTTGIIELKIYRQKFLACRTVYGIKAGLAQQKEREDYDEHGE